MSRVGEPRANRAQEIASVGESAISNWSFEPSDVSSSLRILLLNIIVHSLDDMITVWKSSVLVEI